MNQDFTQDIKTYIAVNERLQVRQLDAPETATYNSRINDIVDGKLMVSWPAHNGTRMMVHRDQILDFYIIRGDVPHEFTGLVDEVYATPLPQIAVILSSAVRRVQRRQNFRIKCLMPVEISGIIRDRKDESATRLEIRTVTCDLSASGMAIRYSKPLPEGAEVEALLTLPDEGPAIKVPCRVIYSENPAENQALYRTGLRYLAINESERARIVRYVYRTQLKGLRP